MILRGANIEEKNVEYKKLSDYDWTDDKELIEIVKNNNYSENELDEINTLFPEAVIFDSSKKVLRYPFINNQQNDEIDTRRH